MERQRHDATSAGFGVATPTSNFEDFAARENPQNWQVCVHLPCLPFSEHGMVYQKGGQDGLGPARGCIIKRFRDL